MPTRFLATAATLLTAAGLAAADAKAAEMPAGLRTAVDRAVHQVERDGAGHKAYNPQQQYGMRFQESAASVKVEDGELRMQLSGWGRRLAMRTPAAPVVSAEGNRLQYRRGEITEWYVNDARGLEQGFTLNARPAGGGPLAVALKVTGDWTPRLESGAEVVLERRGHAALRYGGLKAWDAAGRPLPSRMEVEGWEIRLMVDDAEARYPVTVDPLIQRAKLTAADGEVGTLGCAVAISGDTAVAGACGNVSNGFAYIFVRSGNTWSAQQKLTASDVADPREFGASVAISGDTVVVGANRDSNSTGSAYVFVRSAGIWSQQQKLTASDPASLDHFGFAVAVDGDTAAIGAPGDDSSMGSMYIFTRAGGTWSQQQKVTAVTRGSDYQFGAAVALEGSTVAVGEYGYSVSRGDVYVFVKTGGAWTVQAQLLASDGASYDALGISVGLSGDTVVAGARGDNSSKGAAYVFVRAAGAWSMQQKLVVSAGVHGDAFGSSVAVSGDLAIVGAYLNNTSKGAAYLFARSGTSWSQWQKLTASDVAEFDYFGTSVALSGDVVLSSAPNNNSRKGAVYAFSAALASISTNIPGQHFTTPGAAGGCPGEGTQTTPVDLHWVSSSPCTITFTSPYSVAEGQQYVFQSWQDGGGGNPRLLQPLPVDATYPANFENQYQLTTAVNPVWAGSVTGAGWYPASSTAVAAAFPVSGTTFTGFSGDLSGAATPRQVSMTQPRSVTGNFTPTPLANLSASIIAKSGTQAARVWTIALSNAGPGSAIAAQLHGIQLTQTFGAACVPLRLAPSFPVAYANFGPGQSVATPVTFDFTGCPDTARFTAAFIFSANSGNVVGLSTVLNQTR